MDFPALDFSRQKPSRSFRSQRESLQIYEIQQALDNVNCIPEGSRLKTPCVISVAQS